MKTWKLSVFLSCFLSVFPQQRVIRLMCVAMDTAAS